MLGSCRRRGPRQCDRDHGHGAQREADRRRPRRSGQQYQQRDGDEQPYRRHRDHDHRAALSPNARHVRQQSTRYGDRSRQTCLCQTPAGGELPSGTGEAHPRERENPQRRSAEEHPPAAAGRARSEVGGPPCEQRAHDRAAGADGDGGRRPACGGVRSLDLRRSSRDRHGRRRNEGGQQEELREVRLQAEHPRLVGRCVPAITEQRFSRDMVHDGLSSGVPASGLGGMIGRALRRAEHGAVPAVGRGATTPAEYRIWRARRLWETDRRATRAARRILSGTTPAWPCRRLCRRSRTPSRSRTTTPSWICSGPTGSR